MNSMSHLLPSLGMYDGQGATDGTGAVSQNQTGVPIGFVMHWAQGGPGGPGVQLHGTHEHSEAG